MGQHLGWRSAFWAVVVLSTLTMGLIRLLVPGSPGRPEATGMRELKAFASAQVWLTLLAGAIGFGGMFAVYTYISPTVTEVGGLGSGAVPVFLLAWLRFGIAAAAMAGWVRRPAAEAPLSAHDRRLLFLESFLGNFLFSVCMLFGVAHSTAVAAGVIMAGIPAAVTYSGRVADPRRTSIACDAARNRVLATPTTGTPSSACTRAPRPGRPSGSRSTYPSTTSRSSGSTPPSTARSAGSSRAKKAPGS